MTRLVVSTLLLLLLSSEAVQGQSETTSDPFLEAARKREAKVKVVDVTFTMKEILLKNSATPMAELLPAFGKAATTLPEDLVIESTNRFVIQNTMMRFEGNHPLWHLASGKPLPDQRITVSNSQSSRSYYPKGRGKDAQVSGAIKNDLVNTSMDNYYLIPLSVAFRGLNRNLTPHSVQLFVKSSARQRVDGNECFEYTYLAGKHNRMSYLVDPKLDHNVVRIIYVRQGKIFCQIDIKYGRNPICEWMPESWVEHSYSATGKTERRTEVRVASCKFNETLPEDQFELVFPAGTRVYNSADAKYYMTESGGGLRLLSSSGEELTPTISQQGDSWPPRWMPWLLGCGGGVIIIIVLYVLYGRKEGRASDETRAV
jgi:hypothetical protein